MKPSKECFLNETISTEIQAAYVDGVGEFNEFSDPSQTLAIQLIQDCVGRYVPSVLSFSQPMLSKTVTSFGHEGVISG